MIRLAALALLTLALAACYARGAIVARTEPCAARDMSGRLDGTEQDTAGFKPIVAAEDPGDRDLGPGADGEKLGGRRWQGEAMVDPQTGERYAPVLDNPFVRTSAPGGDASTFGLDVDTASFANCRRWLLEMGRLPPPGAVRLEELVNAQPYAYPAVPADAEAPLAAQAAVAACPWAPRHRLVRLALRARSLDAAARPPLNLVFLVDVSGSMADANKLPLVCDSLLLLAEQLGAADRLAIVTYAGAVGTALPATPGDEQQRIRAAIRGLRAGGSTNGEGGLRAAYREARGNARPGTVSRVVLCSDGDFNVGVTGRDELRELVVRERAGGVQLNVYGFGMGNLKDDTLETLADHGDGIYGYIDSAAEARRLFDRGAIGQLVTVAKDAKAQVFFNPAAVAAWRLLGYENRQLRREDFNDDAIDAGDVGAGHTVTVLYEVVPAGEAVPAGRGADANPFLAAAAPAGDPGSLLRLRLRWKDPGQEASRLRELDVPNAVSEMDADFRSAAAAAGMGMLLRRSPWAGDCDWPLLARLAEAGRASPQAEDLRRMIARAAAPAR